MSRFIVMSKAAEMPASCWGRYARVAVVETDLPEGQEPKMITQRAKGVIRVVETWENCNVGLTHKSAFHRARAEAEALADKLNAKGATT